MASLQELVCAIAPRDGRSVKDLAYLARVVRESGLLRTEGRGGAAAKATIADAAILLIALNCLDSGKGLRGTTEKFMTLKRHITALRRPTGGGEDAANILANLVHRAPDFFAFLQLAINAVPILEEIMPRGAPRQLRIGFRSGPMAYVRIVENLGAGPEILTEARFIWDADLMMSGFYSAPDDRSVTAEVGLPTLISLHETLFPADMSAFRGLPLTHPSPVHS